MAAGVDRIVMLLVGRENLREITMFPMNQQAYDLLMNAPSERRRPEQFSGGHWRHPERQ
jgi:aspartyl-tRNA synthetase